MQVIDGSQLEGGGQILRVSTTLSTLLDKPIHIYAIRAGRSKPGLAAQHLSGVHIAKQISEGETRGAEIGSAELQFIPKPSKVRELQSQYFEDCGTAGAITLMAQTAVPCIALRNIASSTNGTREAESSPSSLSTSVKLELWGGTNVAHSPPIDHIEHVLFPLFKCFGITATVDWVRRGYYPRGGGKVKLSVTPVAALLTPIDLTTQGSLVSLQAVVYGNADLATRQHVAQLLIDSITTTPLVAADGSTISTIDVTVPPAFTDNKQRNGKKERCTVVGVQMWATTSTGCVLSANGDVSLKTITDQAVVDMVNRMSADLRTLCASGACIDEHTADQLIIYMTQCAGVSRMLMPSAVTSLHLVTAIKIATDLTGARFEIVPGTHTTSDDEQRSENQMVICHGREN